MPRDLSGNYTLPAGNPVVTGTIIDVAWANPTMADLALQLNNVMTRSGILPATADMPLGGFKLSGVGDGVALQDAVTIKQYQNGSPVNLTAVAGTNTITATLTSMTAYTAGMQLTLIAASTNTGATTININSLGAKSITKNGITALAAGDILAGGAYVLTYDGTQFQCSGNLGSGAAFVPEVYTATAGQTVFPLVNGYTVGANTLEVYVNGLLVNLGTDYTETSTLSVTFTSGLTVGDEAKFIVWRTNIATSGDAATMSFIQSGTGAVATTVQTKLRESVSVLDFYANGVSGVPVDPTGVVNSSLGFAAALATGKTVFVPDGQYLVDLSVSGALNMVAGQCIYGNGTASKILFKNTTLVQITGLNANSNCSIIGLNFDVSNTTTAFVDNTENTDSGKNFNYNNYILTLSAVSAAHDIVVTNCTFSHSWAGINVSNLINIRVTNCTFYQLGVWLTQFYNCIGVIFSNNICKYGGSGGGVAASSCKDSTFSNNVVITSGTGINIGGSSTAGYNALRISITGNRVTSRDCILCENGIVGVAISGNICSVLFDTVIGGSNGTGIACTSDSGGVAGGLLGDIAIAGNTIENYNSPVSDGILIGCTATPAFDMYNVSVTGNTINATSASGIEFRMTSVATSINDVVVSGNNIIATRGIVLNNVTKAVVTGNVCKTTATTIIGNYYGIWSYVTNYVTISNNSLIGFGVSNKLETVTATVLDGNRTLPITAGSGSDIVSNVGSPSWFARNNGVVLQTSTALSLLINSDTQTYTPASAIVIPGTLNGFIPSGSLISIYFGNGNTTIQHGGSISLRGAVSVVPTAGQIITFRQLGATLYEVSRNF